MRCLRQSSLAGRAPCHACGRSATYSCGGGSAVHRPTRTAQGRYSAAHCRRAGTAFTTDVRVVCGP